ncbi:uncharacterized protein LOC141817923 [Curcuma longa]|uniref:uncharacterized protein LOC141817923 n=1 Tax=Curcuma longa TaxID=136217 RepID=UPI003D9EF156
MNPLGSVILLAAVTYLASLPLLVLFYRRPHTLRSSSSAPSRSPVARTAEIRSSSASLSAFLPPSRASLSAAGYEDSARRGEERSRTLEPSKWKLLVAWHLVQNTGRTVTKSLSSSNLICASLRSNGHPRLSYGGGFDKEPFWINVVKDIAWSLKCVAVFLAEQPNQIKYIEWPAFESTLRTARVTLVLVALLIVALSSVDSCLCYILALLVRRTA